MFGILTPTYMHNKYYECTKTCIWYICICVFGNLATPPLTSPLTPLLTQIIIEEVFATSFPYLQSPVHTPNSHLSTLPTVTWPYSQKSSVTKSHTPLIASRSVLCFSHLKWTGWRHLDTCKTLKPRKRYLDLRVNQEDLSCQTTKVLSDNWA